VTAARSSFKIQSSRVNADAASARVILVQRWALGGFSGVGSKEPVLRRGPGGFRLAREELFGSATGKTGEVDVEAFHWFAFVVDGEVASARPERRVAVGAAVLEKQGADNLPIRAVVRSTSPSCRPPCPARREADSPSEFRWRGAARQKLGALPPSSGSPRPCLRAASAPAADLATRAPKVALGRPGAWATFHR
jgi:hypothetical protein